jgi:uncharacterized protein YcbK (DUF882 family)
LRQPRLSKAFWISARASVLASYGSSIQAKLALSRKAAPKCFLAAATCLPALSLCIFGISSTETAVANGDTRTIRLHHAHTNESIEATYRVNGRYDPAVLEKLNWFLRDWRREEATKMDPRLFDAVWEAYRSAGATDPIVVVCGYRSPQTNAMLRSRSRGVAEHSQHMLGKAMDTTMPGMPMERVREMAMHLQLGGVGYYGSSNFVHIDVGGVRSWPRMSYDQLARLFPDGKTVHIASNGQTLARYEEARAEIAARGGAADVPPSSQGPNFLAWLFGGGHSEDENEEVAAVAVAEAPAPSRVALRSRSAPADSRPADDNRSTAVASLTEDNGRLQNAYDRENDTAVGKPLPLPPARPVELASLDSDEIQIPLPPTRPVAAAVAGAASKAEVAPKKDAISNLIAANSSVAPARASGLPDLITQGSANAQKAPVAVLAYAASTPIEGLRSAARSKKAELPLHAAIPTQAPPPMVPARLDHSNFLAMTGPIKAARLSTQTVLGPTVAGLRQMARNELRIEASALSNFALSVQQGGFKVAVNDLPADRFVDTSSIAYASANGADRVHVAADSLGLKSGE